MNIYSVTRANINYYFIPVKYVSAFYYVHFNDLLGCIEFFYFSIFNFNRYNSDCNLFVSLDMYK